MKLLTLLLVVPALLLAADSDNLVVTKLDKAGCDMMRTYLPFAVGKCAPRVTAIVRGVKDFPLVEFTLIYESDGITKTEVQAVRTSGDYAGVVFDGMPDVYKARVIAQPLAKTPASYSSESQ